MTGTTKTTVRVPQPLDTRLERLVTAGEYPNKSEAVRDGIRLLLSLYDFSTHPPQRREGEFDRLDHAEDRAAAARMMTRLWNRPRNGDRVIIYDEAGAFKGVPKPPGTTIVTTRREFTEAMERLP